MIVMIQYVDVSSYGWFCARVNGATALGYQFLWKDGTWHDSAKTRRSSPGWFNSERAIRRLLPQRNCVIVGREDFHAAVRNHWRRR